MVVYDAALNAQGIPSWIAQDPDRQWTVDEVVDNAAAALDAAREEYERGQGKNHGLRLVVVEKPSARPDRLDDQPGQPEQ